MQQQSPWSPQVGTTRFERISPAVEKQKEEKVKEANYCMGMAQYADGMQMQSSLILDTRTYCGSQFSGTKLRLVTNFRPPLNDNCALRQDLICVIAKVYSSTKHVDATC